MFCGTSPNRWRGSSLSGRCDGTAGVPVFVPVFVLESFSMTSLRVCLQTEQV